MFKKLIKKINYYRNRKRLSKYVTVNLKLTWRKLIKALKSERLHRALKSVPAIMSYISVGFVGVIIAGMFLFTKYACPYFTSDERIMRRLTMSEYDSDISYLRALDAFGSSNRIQMTLKTDVENYVNPRGVDLDRGGVNLILTFSDGKNVEINLDNSNYDNFESGMEDTFTIILPYGYTPFDITDYTIAVYSDINNKYDSWHCKWARAYFMLGNEAVMLAKETWDDVAVFGDGETEIKKSSLEIVHTDNTRYQRTEKLYSHYLALADAGMTDFRSEQLRIDALYSMSLTAGKYLWVDIETVDIEIQNDLLTYYTKGVDIPETDSLDYDGLMYLDITFYTAKEDGTYTESYLLDTLGTDDFELGSTSVFQLEMPKGLCVFDICSMSIRTDNPYDSWAPRYIRAYIKPDYADKLEIGRLNDVMLTNDYATAVFYKNLIESPISIDLSSQFAISSVVKKQFEETHGFTLGANTAKIYFELQSFYDRQMAFYDKLVELYSDTVYSDVETEDTDTEPTPPVTDDDTAVPDTEPEEETGEPDTEVENTPDTEQPDDNEDNSKPSVDGTEEPEPTPPPVTDTPTEDEPVNDPSDDVETTPPTEEQTPTPDEEQVSDTETPGEDTTVQNPTPEPDQSTEEDGGMEEQLPPAEDITSGEVSGI